ncbi:MAG TPA: trehalose-phosphatase [Noviherbaspirillum sp.]|uniref:trehalose-phosphatase n=1 Tax=Noviherbaspirillum sp. TaxID=1926288 RepID=UPI002D381F82|nr:trehalose-phosphatase [Noviherbaspirillum sp.]HYD94575.1 trehalose-phosphatase [Noviherbaspirillum sp.]
MVEIVKPGMLCAFDFDGTLAPVVKDAHRASIPADVLRRMITLSEHARVAVISGRSVVDVGVRLDFLPDFVVGNHGIEGLPGWEDKADRYQTLCLAWERHLKAALADRVLFDSGVWLENRTYSLSVHYRMVRNREEAEARLLQLFSSLSPQAKIVAGKYVFNLLPADAPDKGSALARLCEVSGAPSAIYVGDGMTDEDVFKMRRRDWLTVRVERAGDSAAEFYLHHRLDMVQFLDALISQLCKAKVPAAPVRQYATKVG